MNLQVCVFLCVLTVCITVLIVQIIEHYPEWCTYYEYKDKAKQFDDIQKQYCDKIKELSKSIDNINKFGGKESRAAFEYLADICNIRNIINTNNSTFEAVKEIKEYLKNHGL